MSASPLRAKHQAHPVEDPKGEATTGHLGGAQDADADAVNEVARPLHSAAVLFFVGPLPESHHMLAGGLGTNKIIYGHTLKASAAS